MPTFSQLPGGKFGRSRFACSGEYRAAGGSASGVTIAGDLPFLSAVSAGSVENGVGYSAALKPVAFTTAAQRAASAETLRSNAAPDSSGISKFSASSFLR